MNIMYLRPYPGEMDLIAESLPEHTIHAVEDVWDISEEGRSNITILSVFVDYKVTSDVLDALPACKLIATRSAGFDHIDTKSAHDRGITVVRVPHYGTRTVAEYVFALLFSLSRQAYSAYIDLQKSNSAVNMNLYEGFDLAGKTLGVVGVGAIGKNVCQIALGIGMKVLAYDAYPDQDFAMENGFTFTSLEKVLTESDIVTLHVPSLPETYHLMGEGNLALMKKGSYLINTARGNIIDTKALVLALKSENLAGAALDVLEGELEFYHEDHLLTDNAAHSELWQQLIANHVLLDMPNVIVTPHIAFNTKEAKREITETTLANLNAWIKETPINTVNYEHN